MLTCSWWIFGLILTVCQCGEVVDVRFPSLKYNTHRRFCYVQFGSAGEARAAAKLDGTKVGDDLHLVAKISDPSKKQERHGAVHEGREIHVSNLDWKATEDDLKELFSKYGQVEVARIPTKVDGGSKGFGFVAFSTKVRCHLYYRLNCRRCPFANKLSRRRQMLRSKWIRKNSGDGLCT
jgi:hypothetical protein